MYIPPERTVDFAAQAVAATPWPTAQHSPVLDPPPRFPDVVLHRLTFVSLVIGSLAACGGSETAAPPQPPTIGVTLVPSTVDLQAGQQVTMQVAVNRTNYTKDVLLAVTDLPASVSAVVTPAIVPAGVSTVTLALTAGRGAIPGLYTAAVTVAGEGVGANRASLGVHVTPLPAISITAKPDSITLMQGDTGSVFLDIERTNFVDAVAFSSGGEPFGVQTQFPAGPATGSVTKVAFSVASGATPGTYVIRVNGSAFGITTVTTRVRLTVRARPVPALALSLTRSVLAVQQGRSDTASITVLRTDYTGPVSLTASGLPPGIVVSFDATSVMANTATATFIVGTNAPLGTLPITIQATAPGVVTATANVDLIIRPIPSFTLFIRPDSLSAVGGVTVAAKAILARTNFTGPIALSVGVLPGGVSAQFSDSNTTAGEAELQLTLAPQVVPGTYVVRVVASAAGLGAQETTLRLVVR